MSNPASLIGANLLAYAKAWEAENAADLAKDDILRSWRGVPTRLQMREHRRREREDAKRRTSLEMAAREAGLA